MPLSLDPRGVLRALLDAALAAARPEDCLPPHLPADRDRPLIVLGAGKAAVAMARAVEAHWRGPLTGAVVTRYGQGERLSRIEVMEAAHPVPDAAGLAAGRRLLALAQAAGPDDTVLCLISGGGSALMEVLPDGLDLEDIARLNRGLLASGASIDEMNCVRRHLSRVKGGRLAAAVHPARLLTLAISDVPGDRFLDIASGPTVADPTTVADAVAILERHRIDVPEAVAAVLASPQAESVKPGDARLARAEIVLVASPSLALAAAAEKARALGLAPLVLGDRIEGEAREAARVLAGLALGLDAPFAPRSTPTVILSGGETTVTLRGAVATGRGGRNAEFQLAFALASNGAVGLHALAVDTDAADGCEEIAGAFVDPTTLARARALGLDARAALAAHDAHAFFEALGDGCVTGPTGTNVNDFRAQLILPDDRDRSGLDLVST